MKQLCLSNSSYLFNDSQDRKGQALLTRGNVDQQDVRAEPKGFCPFSLLVCLIKPF